MFVVFLPFIKLGQVSNSLFIWHHPILYIIYGMSLLNIIEISMDSWLTFLIYIAIVVGIGIISNLFVEKAVMKLMNKII